MSADLALIFSMALMGLAGAPHCAAMCSGPCAGVLRACVADGAGAPAASMWSTASAGKTMAALMATRIVGYSVGGAVTAGAVSGLQALGAAAPALRIFWTLLHMAALGLGVWLLATGRQPLWWSRLGAERPRPAAAAFAAAPVPVTASVLVPFGTLRRRLHAPARLGLFGMVWVLLPCGLLQSALVVASLTSRPLTGAAAMAVFALASTPGLVALPLWLQRGGRGASAWSLRAAGALLAAASLFALGHGLWQRIAAYCLN